MAGKAIVGLIVGSFRTHGNTEGIASWVQYYVKSLYPEITLKVYTPVSPINLMSEPIDPVVPMKISSPEQYVNPIVRSWAKAVQECNAYVILTPEYNHSYSGHLKVMFDHIYNEFRGKPGTLLTFSGHGAEKSYEELTNLTLKFGVKITGGMHFSIPMEYVVSNKRIVSNFDPNSSQDSFLKKLTPSLVSELEKTLDSLRYQ